MTSLALALVLAGAQPTPSWGSLDASARGAELEALADKPLPERLVAVSERFLGTRYLLSPLGEGEGKDPDPLIRFDAVDCLTFVEETIAMSLLRRPAELDELLARIRYAKVPAYEDRNHVMEAQWLPNNVAKGFLEEVTLSHGGKDVVAAKKVLDGKSWRSRSARALGLPEDKRPLDTFRLSMIPLEKVAAHARAIPEGTLLVVIREDRPGLVTRVSHVGFVLHRSGRAFLRHAGSVAGKVVDEELGHFLARNARFDKWPVDGVALYRVLPRGVEPQASSGSP